VNGFVFAFAVVLMITSHQGVFIYFTSLLISSTSAFT
jgi:hypothetical protein